MTHCDHVLRYAEYLNAMVDTYGLPIYEGTVRNPPNKTTLQLYRKCITPCACVVCHGIRAIVPIGSS